MYGFIKKGLQVQILIHLKIGTSSSRQSSQEVEDSPRD